MPSAKVFTAILAAMAVPMANAGNCKPKPVTTTDVALPGVTTSGTVTVITSGTETGTPTTETSAATTTEAACSKYTPYELQPADCGKKGVAPNCGDKIIGTPSTCVDWTECGNTCGKTLGCKSFSVKGRTCTLYKTVVGELGWTASEGAGSSEFYDLELCFTCAEESSATSGTDTATGVQTTETAAGTETTDTAVVQTTNTATVGQTTETVVGTETTETAAGTETTETAAGTETTDTAVGVQTTDTATGVQTTETAAGTETTDTATGVQTTETAAGTETTDTATGVQTTETAAGTETTDTATAGQTTETAAGTETTEAAVTTTEAASTTVAGCTAAYTTVDSAPVESCAVMGRSDGSPIEMYRDIDSADECATKCADYVNEENAGEVCNTFSYQVESGSCQLYADSLYELNVDDSECEEGSICPADSSFYELHACYAKCDGYVVPTTTEAGTTEATGTTDAAVTTTDAATTTEAGTTEEAAGTTTEAAATTDAAVTTTEAGTTDAAVTTTDAAITTEAGTTEAAAGTTTEEAAGTTTDAAVTTTEAAGTTNAAVTTTEAGTTEEAAGTTTEAAATTDAAATTTEAGTTTEAAPVCTNYIPKPDRPSTCGQQGKVSCRSSQKLGQPTWAASADKCGKICGTTEGCKTFSFKYNGSKCQLYSAALDQLTFTPCNTGVKFYDLEKCYTCQNEVTPPPPATCSKYVSDPNCSSNTYCGTRGSICEEVLIPNVGDASCLENCAKSCIEYGAECVYFSYKPTTPWGSAKCKLYKSGKIIKNKNSIIKFYQQPCFKCQNPPAL
ncbi:hypothetical protein ACHAPZ_007585 [Fusarium culmorum]